MPSFTITLTNAQAQRAAKAFGELLHPGTDADLQDLKAYYAQDMRRIVQEYENRQALAAMPAPAAFDPA